MGGVGAVAAVAPEPDTAEAWAAATLLALAGDRLKRAEAALGNCSRTPLGPHLRRRLALQVEARRDREAKQTWASLAGKGAERMELIVFIVVKNRLADPPLNTKPVFSSPLTSAQ